MEVDCIPSNPCLWKCPLQLFPPPQAVNSGARGRGIIFHSRPAWKSTMDVSLSRCDSSVRLAAQPWPGRLAALTRSPVTASPLPTALGPHPSTPATSRRRLAAIFARSIISHPFRPPPPPATQHAASDDHDDDVCVPGHGGDCPARPCRAPQPASHRPAPPRHRHLDAAVSRHRVCFLSFALGALRRDGQAEIRLELIPVHIG